MRSGKRRTFDLQGVRTSQLATHDGFLRKSGQTAAVGRKRGQRTGLHQAFCAQSDLPQQRAPQDSGGSESPPGAAAAVTQAHRYCFPLCHCSRGLPVQCFLSRVLCTVRSDLAVPITACSLSSSVLAFLPFPVRAGSPWLSQERRAKTDYGWHGWHLHFV